MASDVDALADAILDSGHTPTEQGLAVTVWKDPWVEGLVKLTGDQSGRKWLEVAGRNLNLDPWADQGDQPDLSLLAAQDIGKLAGVLYRQGVNRLLGIISDRAVATSLETRVYSRLIGQELFEFVELVDRKDVRAQIVVSTLNDDFKFTVESKAGGKLHDLGLPSNLDGLPLSLSDPKRVLPRITWLLHGANSSSESGNVQPILEARYARNPQRYLPQLALTRRDLLRIERDTKLLTQATEVESFCEVTKECTRFCVEIGAELIGFSVMLDGNVHIEVVDTLKPENKSWVMFNNDKQEMSFEEYKNGLLTIVRGSSAVRVWDKITDKITKAAQEGYLKSTNRQDLFMSPQLKAYKGASNDK